MIACSEEPVHVTLYFEAIRKGVLSAPAGQHDERNC